MSNVEEFWVGLCFIGLIALITIAVLGTIMKN